MKSLLQPLYCLFGKHHRSRSRAWSDGTSFHSHCDGCGKPMIRGASGWSVDPNPPTSSDKDG
jgi:hypothetical protein